MGKLIFKNNSLTNRLTFIIVRPTGSWKYQSLIWCCGSCCASSL